MVYSVGQRVTMLHCEYRTPWRNRMDGHTCIIKEVLPFYESHCYLLEWRAEDNPGRELHFDISFDISISTFHEEDFTAVLLPGTIVHSHDLPDI